MLARGSMATLYAIKELGISGSWLIIAAACVGAGSTMLLVLILSRRLRDNVMMLIVGIMIGSITLALISIWQYFSNPEQVKDYLLWNFGSLGGVTGGQLSILAVVVVIGLIVASLSAKMLDALLLGENYARSMGLSAGKARAVIICSTSLLAGSITGLLRPHRFYRDRRSASRPVPVQHRQPSHPDPRLLSDRDDPFAALRYIRPAAGHPDRSADQYHHLSYRRSPGRSTPIASNNGPLMVSAAISLLHARDLQTGYRSGAKRIIVANALPELQLQPGQLICLLGPNGSGKSACSPPLGGMPPPLGGVIHIEGIDRWTPATLARKISLVLTDRVSGNNLTVDTLVALGRYPWLGWLGGLNATDRASIEWAMRATGIGSLGTGRSIPSATARARRSCWPGPWHRTRRS